MKTTVVLGLERIGITTARVLFIRFVPSIST